MFKQTMEDYDTLDFPPMDFNTERCLPNGQLASTWRRISTFVLAKGEKESGLRGLVCALKKHKEVEEKLKFKQAKPLRRVSHITPRRRPRDLRKKTICEGSSHLRNLITHEWVTPSGNHHQDQKRRPQPCCAPCTPSVKGPSTRQATVPPSLSVRRAAPRKPSVTVS